MRLIKYLGWEVCGLSEYKVASNRYGFNNETSPRYIEFAVDNGANLDFFLLVKNGDVAGACCVDSGWLCNDIKNPKSQTKELLVPKYSVLCPFRDDINFILPFKSKCLASAGKKPMNASFGLFSKRDSAVVKGTSEFSRKTASTRNRESKKFFSDGGEFRSVSNLSDSEICGIYGHLYSLRRPGHRALSSLNEKFISHFKKNIFGDVAFLNGSPVAFQLNLTSISKYGVFIDFINIGYDVSVKNHSLGTLIMWRNLQLAEAYALENEAPLTYSFGMMSGEYKTRWCNPTRVGRVVT